MKTPSGIVREAYRRIAQQRQPIWIHLVPEADALARAAELESDPHNARLPLYGVTFAVKDNIDVAGMPTTAACPAFAYAPAESAFAVERLLAAGAILIGKTNLDQFATGLVGTRSPYGACSSVFDDRYISGGSSSGSAVAVALGLVDFALGTDTAGSGRVPAAFNNIVGLKPTRGVISTRGVVPACRTLDCVSIFARNCADAERAFEIARCFDAADPFSRRDASAYLPSRPRYGVPRRDQLEFFGDKEAAKLFEEAAEDLSDLGAERVEIDFEPFLHAAQLLYSGPWVAERLAAIQEFVAAHGDEMHPITREIISGGSRPSAVDAFRGAYRLAELAREAEAQWAAMDVMLLPTAGTIYTHEAVAAEPVRLNTNLGYYTNFVNLMDLSAVAVPAGFRANGLPFGVTLMGRAFTDDALLALAARFHRPRVLLAVVGAHLSGQPLNRQLTDRRARLVKTARTARDYRLYALTGTTPPKPGLVHVPGASGPGIEVEVWNLSEEAFGSFVASVPPPMTIGSGTLEDGSTLKSFLCEPFALEGAEEITQYGGWRAYLNRDQA